MSSALRLSRGQMSFILSDGVVRSNDADQQDGQVADQLRADDAALADGALRGDEDALGRLLARDQEWAYNVAYRVLGQEADARDAVQDAFLLTVRALRGDGSPPRSGDSFRPWLRRVVT